MLRSKLFVAAKDVVRDARTDSVSVFSILEGVTSEGFPFFIQQLALLSIWEKDEADPAVYELTLRVENNNQVLNEAPLRLQFEGTTRHRAITNISGLTVPEPGILRFVFIDEEGEELESYEITVEGPDTDVNQERTEDSGDAAEARAG